MFRASLDPSSSNAFLFFRAGGITGFQSHSDQDTWTEGTWVGTPYWLKLVRLGDAFYAYDSADGTQWKLIARTNVYLPTTCFLGMAVTSHRYGQTCAGTFDNLQLASPPGAPTGFMAFRAFDSIHLSWRDNATNEQGFIIESSRDATTWYQFPAALPPNTTNFIYPWVTEWFYRVKATNLVDSPYSEIAFAISGALDPIPSRWHSADVGPVLYPGCDNFHDGVFRVGGFGSDIGGTQDSFHFVYKQFAGDGEIIAFFPDSLMDYGGFYDYWAKTGLMIRQSLDSDAANAFVFLTPGHGANSQVRATRGASTTLIPTTQWRYPGIWLRLRRRGNIFEMYLAGQDMVWTQVTSAQVQMTGPVYAGMAVTSHYSNCLQLCDFANTSVGPLQGELELNRQPNGVLALDLHGCIQSTYRIDASTNLMSWTPLSTQLNTSGVIVFTDLDVPLHPKRFYRAALVQ